MGKGLLKKLCEQFPRYRFTHKFASEDFGYEIGERIMQGNFEFEEEEICIEAGSKDAIEFAADVWGYDIKTDMRMQLNADGTNYESIYE